MPNQNRLLNFISQNVARTARAISHFYDNTGTGPGPASSKPAPRTAKKETIVTLPDGSVLYTVPGEQLTGAGPIILMPPTNDLENKAAAQDPLKNSAVASAVNYLKRVFSEAPLVVEELQPDGAGRLVPDHPLTALLDDPNPIYPGVLLKAGMIASWALTGSAYLLKVYSRAGKLVELYLIRPDLIWPVADEKGLLAYYAYKPNPNQGEPDKLKPSEVVHIRWDLDPNNPLKGMSPFYSLLLEILSDSSATRLAAALVENMGVPSVLITPADKEIEFDPNLADDLADQWQGTTGGTNAGKPVVVAAALNVEKISFSPADLDLKQVHRLPEERIAAVLGVPAIVLNLGAGLEASTYNNVEAARKIAYEACIIPMQNILTPQLSKQLLPEFEKNPKRYRVAFDNSEVRVLQPDLNATAERLTAGYQAGTVKRSEVREAQKLPVKNSEDDFYKYEIEARAAAEAAALSAEPTALPAPAPAALPAGATPAPDQTPAADPSAAPTDQPAPAEPAPAEPAPLPASQGE